MKAASNIVLRLLGILPRIKERGTHVAAFLKIPTKTENCWNYFVFTNNKLLTMFAIYRRREVKAA